MMHAVYILCVSVSPVHHLHDLHHVQVNGVTLTLSNSQHCINHNLQVHEKMVVKGGERERERERGREGGREGEGEREERGIPL